MKASNTYNLFLFILKTLKPTIKRDGHSVMLDCGDEHSCAGCQFHGGCHDQFAMMLPNLVGKDYEFFLENNPELFI